MALDRNSLSRAVHSFSSTHRHGQKIGALAIGVILAGLNPCTASSAQERTVVAKKAELETVHVVHSGDPDSTMVAAHSALIHESFGVDIGRGLAVFTLSRSVFEEGVNSSGSGEVGALCWTTYSISEYAWSDFPEHAAVATSLADRRVRGAVVVGVLKGSAASVASVALGFEFDDGQGGSSSLLIPLTRVNADPEVLLAQAGPPLGEPCIGAASGRMPCSSRYDTRRGDALRAFVGCMATNVAPVGLGTAICIAACGLTGPLMPACVAACLGVGGPALIVDFHSCTEELERANCNAAQAYCNCIRHQQTYCPQVAEPDRIGCPGNPTLPVPGCP